MPELDALVLARLQFAFTISFHIIFPAFTIGLASYLAVLEGLWLRTRDEVYIDLYRFWVQIFAVSFGMGVVSGVVLSYQFGTNWSRFWCRRRRHSGRCRLRGADRLLPGGGLPGGHAVRPEEVGRGLHFLADLPGRVRHR